MKKLITVPVNSEFSITNQLVIPFVIPLITFVLRNRKELLRSRRKVLIKSKLSYKDIKLIMNTTFYLNKFIFTKLPDYFNAYCK